MKQNFKHHYSFLSPFLILFLLITLTGCGDFADIFQKGNRTAKAPSKKSKEKVVGQKNRSVKGKVVTGRFIWPLQSEVSSGFGERDGKPHDGIDIRSPKETPFMASADGEVIFAASYQGYGNMILVKHDENYVSVYAHCDEILVKDKQKVSQGEVIGKVGATGRATGYHLHFEIRYQSKPMDPIAFLPSNEHSKMIGKMTNE